MRNRFIFVLMFLMVFIASCSMLEKKKVEFKADNTIVVTDEKGKDYVCTIKVEKETQKATCSFSIEKNNALLECTISIENSLTFVFSESCKVTLNYEKDQALILPITIKDSKRKHFYNRTVAQILLYRKEMFGEITNYKVYTASNCLTNTMRIHRSELNTSTEDNGSIHAKNYNIECRYFKAFL